MFNTPNNIISFLKYLDNQTKHDDTEGFSQGDKTLLRAVVCNAPIILFALDSRGVFTLAEGRGFGVLGLTPHAIIGTSVFELFANVPDFLARVYQALAGKEVRFEGPVETLYFEFTLTPLYDDHGEVQAVAGIGLDITERKAYQSRIEQLAFTDELTGLANRRRMFELGKEQAEMRTPPDASLTLLYLDLDGFKAVNDTLGHDMGDQLLVQVAARLRSCVRESDTVGRMGGDEFAVLLPDCDRTQAMAITQRILAQFEQPFFLRDQFAKLGISIGMTISTSSTDPFPMLVIQADTAMYEAKRAGGGVQVYHPAACPIAPIDADAQQPELLERSVGYQHRAEPLPRTG